MVTGSLIRMSMGNKNAIDPCVNQEIGSCFEYIEDVVCVWGNKNLVRFQPKYTKPELNNQTKQPKIEIK